MKLITRNTDYAIRALCFIARKKDDIISVSDLVKCLKIPRPFLRKILQTLNKKGLLKSYKGQGGGFSLAIVPEKIFIIDLMRIFQGPFMLNECILKRNVCPDIKNCVLKKKLDIIEKFTVSELKYINIRTLLQEEDRL